MYRIVFFKIPFMRGGYRVPATPFGDSPINHMAGYKVAEIVSDFAFAETQREIVVNGDTAIAIDNGAANYVYIAQTNSETIGVYTNDRRPAYYWVDDLQFVGVSDGTPAAIVTISPDVWLTDFFPNMPTVRGRLAQSTLVYTTSPRTTLTTPIYDTSSLQFADPLSVLSNGYYAVGVFTTAGGGVDIYAIDANTMAFAKNYVTIMGGASKIKYTPAQGDPFEENISCVRAYIIPEKFTRLTTGGSLIETDGTMEYEITGANGARISVYSFRGNVPGTGLKRVLDVSSPRSGNFDTLTSRQFIATPARFVELTYSRGISYSIGTRIPLASFFISVSSSGDDGIKIYMQVGEEFIDVSDDFIADVATNSQAVQQAQQKQLVALQAITGVIGATGGVAGGVASGNYFGAVQAAAGGVQTIAGIGQARRTPAQMRGNGGVASFYGFTNTLVLLISMGTPMNDNEITAVENEYGWQYDNAPFVEYTGTDISADNFYRFSDVVVENVTGGTSAAEEIATAFATGVRLVSL